VNFLNDFIKQNLILLGVDNIVPKNVDRLDAGITNELQNPHGVSQNGVVVVVVVVNVVVVVVVVLVNVVVARSFIHCNI